MRVFLFLILIFLTTRALSPAAEEITARWGFESDPDGWRPRAETVRVERAEGIACPEGGRASLHIQGRLPDQWNYATCGPGDIEAGGLYRLSAWLRVASVAPTTPAPYLKCEFVGPSEKTMAGQARTDTYDLSRSGAWQRLVSEFRVPADAGRFWLALEKGTNGPATIDAWLDEVRVERIERLSALEQYRSVPPAAALEALAKKRPRLYLDGNGIKRLREAVVSDAARSAMANELRKSINQAIKSGPPPYREQDGTSGDEQLWQREVGNTMPSLALAWLLTGDRACLDAATRWALASCGYPTWGLGHFDGRDLAAGHQLFGLAIVYDWCYADLDPAARDTIRETLARRASAMFEGAATGNIGWRRSHLQNHLWVNAAGMAAAGFALHGEVDDAALWIGFALDRFGQTMEALGPDGASHEGVGYWEYGVEYMMKFMVLAREHFARDWFGLDWWRNTARYGLYLNLPRNAWTRANCVVDIADCPRGHWYGPDYLLRGLAGIQRDGVAQWLADEIHSAKVASGGASWLNLLWHDPSVAPQSPAGLPTLRHFEDMGIVSARSDWSGDESLVVFKCGPFIGHRAVQESAYDPGGGHVHPDANHFVLFGNGEWLVRDDGYRAKWTRQHNTLLVDGRGQLGEGKKWFHGQEPLLARARPRVLMAEPAPELDHLAGEAAAAYPAEMGLRRFERHLLFCKPDALLVFDDIETEKPRHLELCFYPECQEFSRDGAAFVFSGKRSVLRIEPLTPEGVTVEAKPFVIEGRQGSGEEQSLGLRLERRDRQWRNVTAFSWAAAGAAPPVVSLQPGQEETKTVRVGARRVDLDWEREPGGSSLRVRP